MSAEPKPGSVAEIVSVLRRWGGMEEIEDVPESLKRMAFSDMLALADWMENSLAMKKRCEHQIPDNGPAQCQAGHWLGSEDHPAGSSAEIEEAYAKGRKHNDVCIAQPLREELQQLREQLEGYRGYVLRIEGSNKTGSGSQLQIVSHQLGLAEKENYELRQQLRQASKHDKALIDAAEQEIQLLRERLKQSQEISDRLERIIDERES